MRIVPQVASASYSSLPPLLDAPRTAGLLPARLPIPSAKVEIVQHQTYRQEAPRKSSSRVVYRSFAEWRAADEELRQFFEGSRRRIDEAYQRYYDRQRARHDLRNEVRNA